jgi:hypothetical protein
MGIFKTNFLKFWVLWNKDGGDRGEGKTILEGFSFLSVASL